MRCMIGETDPTLGLFSIDAWFHLCGENNSRNDRNLYAENPVNLRSAITLVYGVL
jgi:hypothetical protein